MNEHETNDFGSASCICQSCGFEINIRGVPPFSTVKCGNCGAELLIPLIVGHLQIERPVASIPCAGIFLGYDLMADKDVSVCLLEKGVTAPPDWLEQVLAQAAAISKLSHPNIVPLTEYGFLEGEFIATSPTLKGASLSKYDPILNGPFKINSIMELMKTVAEAMAEAHRQGIVHHDLSPASIFIDESRTTWIRDFLPSVLRYQYERWLGEPSGVSPFYISPEKAMGEPEADKGDVFSFGVMFYYLLTGRYPFQDENEDVTIYSRILAGDPLAPASSPYQVLVNPCKIEYRKPIAIRELRPKIQPELDELILRTIAPSAMDRPSFCEIQQLLSALIAAAQAIEQEALQEGLKMVETKKKMIGLTDTRSIPIMKNLAVDAMFAMPPSTKAKITKKGLKK